MSLHKKALGLDRSSMHYEGSGLLGSVPHVGLQSEVLEHMFKELEKKLDKSAAGYREAIEKAQESTSEEKGATKVSAEQNPEVKPASAMGKEKANGEQVYSHYFIPKRPKDEYIKNTRLIGQHLQ